MGFYTLLTAFLLSLQIGNVLAMDRCPKQGQMAEEDKKLLLNKLRISKTGQQLLNDYEKRYQTSGGLKSLSLYWSSVSYSQITNESSKGRSLASVDVKADQDRLGPEICVYLSKSLPEIENVADLAHELTHATRLSIQFLQGHVKNADEFVKTRLEASGGEADAFSMECQLKHEILGQWDALCKPYVREDHIDQSLIVTDFYNGKLSASLTGESYPVLLKRQFQSTHF